MSRMRTMSGFPPEESGRVTLANWQEPDSVRWSFQHMRELMGSHLIPAAPKQRPLPQGPEVDLSEIRLVRLQGAESDVQRVLADTDTDGLVVLHDGAVVAERYAHGQTQATAHLIMSCSKSVVGAVAGILTGRGDLDPAAPVTEYVPEVAESGYAGCTVRDVLDMRTGVRFSEAYTDPEAEVRTIERSMGWRPRRDDDPEGLYAYLATLGTERPHGGRFTYRSADTDMLGWVCERAAGVRMADLVSTLVWRPIGAAAPAEITCDPVGSAVHDGGMSATARDMARFGQMLLEGGTVDGVEVVPSRWLEDCYHPGDDVRQAFADSDNEAVLPGGWYRNQFWLVPGGDSVALVCLGIHGQMVYVRPASRLVAVKQSSWPTAQDVHHLVDTLRAFRALGEALSPDATGTGG